MALYEKMQTLTSSSVILGAAVVVIITMALLRRSRNRLPPGPRRWPGLGNLPQLSGDRMFYEKLNDLRKQHGDIVYLTLGSLKILVVFGHDLVKEVLGPRDEDFKYRPQWLIEIQKLGLFNGIVWSNGECNRQLRQFARSSLAPGVGDRALEGKVQLEATMVHQELLATKGEPTNPINIFHRAISDINYSIIFGSRAEYDDPEFLRLMDMMDQLLQRQGIKNLLNFFPVLRKLPQGKKARHSQDVMREIKTYIKERIEKTRQTFDSDHPRCLLDHYIQSCSKEGTEDLVSDENVCHIIRDLFVAGTENVSIALQWLIAFMVNYPEVQDRCRDTIKDTIGLTNVGSIEDLKKMPYVEAVINEVLRLSNIAPLSVPHATVNEVEFHDFTIPKDTMVLTHLESVHTDPNYWDNAREFINAPLSVPHATVSEVEFHDFTIPKDTMVLTHLESVHTDHNYWDNAREFIPDRFLQDGKIEEKEAFYPFSSGSRYCIAEKLANMEIFLIFCKCLQTFDITLPNGPDPPSLKGIQPGAFVEPQPFQVCFIAKNK